MRSLGFWLTAMGGLALLTAGISCRDAREAALGWPPDAAALVEGQTITMTELNQVLDWGFYGQLSPKEDAPEPPENVPLLVLEKMIEERLVLAEADRRKISLGELENEAVWTDKSYPTLPQTEPMRLNLARQMRLHKITSRIMADERRFSDRDWQAFWRKWPRNKPTRYLVQALFIPLSTDPPLMSAQSRDNLEQLAQKFKLEGFPAILSAAVWLQSDLLDSGLAEVLEAAWEARAPSQPVRQEGSWAIYEVLNLDRKTAAVAELKAARAAYELKTGEEAFHRWLKTRRNAADIRINPSLIQTPE